LRAGREQASSACKNGPTDREWSWLFLICNVL
jgi:hypothetical protein